MAKAFRKDEGLGYALIAGSTAGAAEALVTYPLEYVKTVVQFAPNQPQTTPLQSPGILQVARETLKYNGLKGFYTGVGAVVTGNVLKAGVRFTSYDQFKNLLVTDDGNMTGPRSLLAGLGAGVMESVLVVTPSETIKTKLIEDSRRRDPRYPKGFVQGASSMLRTEGLSGLYRGLFPVAVRQGTTSAVRFASYSTLKSFVSGNSRPGEHLPVGLTFIIGALSSVVTVYATMPLDMIKTRMQAQNSKSQYRNFFHCGARIFAEEGYFKFWKGTTPRLARMMLASGIMFSVYEQVVLGLGGRSAL